MTFEEGIRRSIAAFYKGKLAENINDIQEEIQYTPEYFDSLEEEVLADEMTLEEAMADTEEDADE